MKGAIDRLIVALDHASLDRALELVERLGDEVRWYKVGLELFTRAGPAAVTELKRRGRRVFLDLKLHDIPETAERAARAGSAAGADLLSVHAAGGREMLARAIAGARAEGEAKVLAVTVLTSLVYEDLAADGSALGVADLVVRRAELAHAAGAAGVITSPNEVTLLRHRLAGDLLIVTPGVRPQGAAAGDQKRVATAAEARAAGADQVVVGRPIRDARDPLAATRALLAELV